MTDDKLDAAVREAIANAKESGYAEEMRGWTSYEQAVDLKTYASVFEDVDIERLEASVKRVIGFDEEH